MPGKAKTAGNTGYVFSRAKQWAAIRTRFSQHRASAYRVLLNRNASAFLNRKALSANPLSREKSSTLNEGLLPFIKAEDAGGLAPVKDDNDEKGQKIKFKAGSYSTPLLKQWGAVFTATAARNTSSTTRSCCSMNGRRRSSPSSSF